MHENSVNEGWDWVDDNEKGDKDEGSSGEDTDEAHIILQVTPISKTARTNTEWTPISSKGYE